MKQAVEYEAQGEYNQAIACYCKVSTDMTSDTRLVFKHCASMSWMYRRVRCVWCYASIRKLVENCLSTALSFWFWRKNFTIVFKRKHWRCHFLFSLSTALYESVLVYVVNELIGPNFPYHSCVDKSFTWRQMLRRISKLSQDARQVLDKSGRFSFEVFKYWQSNSGDRSSRPKVHANTKTREGTLTATSLTFCIHFSSREDHGVATGL